MTETVVCQPTHLSVASYLTILIFSFQALLPLIGSSYRRTILAGRCVALHGRENTGEQRTSFFEWWFEILSVPL